MADYGQELMFGFSLTPSAADPAALTRWARTAEQAGFDLITVQDHPYQPRFVDTVALLGQVLAHTERIHVSGDVLNMALRAPALLAKSLATWDLFSGGRMEAGLGAGAFWDAIESYGGRRLSPGQAVDALGEAIRVMRAVWGANGTGPQTVPGRFHHLSEAHPGPIPPHLPEIWVGAYKPRMLALTGSVADGWIPSLPRMTREEMIDAHARIDDAARTAGRDPKTIRRLANAQGRIGRTSGPLLNGPVEQWIDELTMLAVDLGFSAFIVTGDGSPDHRIIAEEIAPAVRELVAQERRTNGVPAHARESTRLAFSKLDRRSPADRDAPLPDGIDYASLPAELRHAAVRPSDPGYREVRSTYSSKGRPGMVLLPPTTTQVATAVMFAAAQNAVLSIRSGGHGVSGSGTNVDGIVIDMSRLSGVEVIDVSRRLVRVATGATWEQVAAALATHGWMISSGNSGSVGVGGTITGGGIGWAVRRAGLTTDHVVEIEIVLANGDIVRADQTRHPDLFWAVRGAGSVAGVVTSVVLEAMDGDQVVYATLQHNLMLPSAFLNEWLVRVDAASDALSAILHLSRTDGSTQAWVSAVWKGSDHDSALADLQQLADAGHLVDAHAQAMSYSSLVPARSEDYDGQHQVRVRSGLVTTVDMELAEVLASLLDEPSVARVEVRPVSGDGARAGARDGSFQLGDATVLIAVWFLPGTAEAEELTWARVAPWVRLVYPAYDSRSASQTLLAGTTDVDRLRRVMSRYDPDRVFSRGLTLQ